MVASSGRSTENPLGSGRILDESVANSLLQDAEKLGASYAEVRLVSSNNTSITVRDGELRRAIPGHDLGATLRVLADGAWGVYSTSDVSSISGAVEGTVRLAKQVAGRRPSSENPIELAEIPIKKGILNWHPKQDIRDVSLEEKLELLSDLDKSIRTDERIVSTITGYSDEHIHTELMTNEGMDRIWSHQRTVANAVITAREDDEVASYRTRIGGGGGFESVANADLEALGRKCSESVLRILGAERAPSGRTTLISDPDLTGVYIHEALGHPCEADLVAAGDSCLEGKLGEKIGSDIVSVIDDPTLKDGYGAYPIDDEGVDARTKNLIVNGVLTEYLNHRETAAKYDLEPNAGARAQSGLFHPLVRMSNTVILGGNHADLDDLLEDVQDGVYACGSRGGQVDTGKGSFQFAAQEAWKIENGQLTTPLKDVSVSGMTLQILSNVDGLCREANLASPGFCGKGQMVPVGDGGPHMRIRNALVG
ncbi:MAG TPA: TldD/PmbA family protein [Candidatus Poseidoniales archaeon]|jgi:TldD protein|nr:TldD/PmbA family protein [Candidatus Poseidoniales archaeon]HIK78036.1 TldD/PmbA family protein [Candidatus Poseidoniales archaeon]